MVSMQNAQHATRRPAIGETAAHLCSDGQVAMFALQSSAYIPASDWVRKFFKVDSDEAQALWKVAWNPKRITITDTDRIFIDVCSRPRSSDRYFVAPDPSHCGDNALLTLQCDGDHVALEEQRDLQALLYNAREALFIAL